MAAAEAALGITQVTSYQAARKLRSGALTRILSEYECVPTPVSLVYASHRLAPLKLRVFLDFVAPRLAHRLATIDHALGECVPLP
jgi:DNA-binding transcriptional LysR family regulator